MRLAAKYWPATRSSRDRNHMSGGVANFGGKVKFC